MSKSNENMPISVPIYLGSLTTNGDLVPALYLPKRSKIESVHLINGAAIVANDTNYAQVSLKNGSTVIAELDTRAAHENGIAINTAEPLNLVAEASEPAAGSALTVLYGEGGTMALTNAVLVVTYYPF